jgi:Tfp pilus assembly protein PilW
MRTPVAGCRQCTSGFSLIELLTALAIFMSVMAIIASALISFQKRYQGEEFNTEVTEKLRSTVELMTFDIDQSGGYAFVPRRLTSAIPGGNTTPQTVSVDNATGLYTGELLLLDSAYNQEVVQVQSVSLTPPQFSAVILQPHASGATVDLAGEFASGVLATSSANTLQLFGDTADSGSLNYVQYTYKPASQMLTRAVTPVGSSAQQPATVQLQNMIANPGGTPTFQYQTQNCGGLNVITAVTFTLTVQTAFKDPQTDTLRAQTAATEVRPRNALAACRLGTDNVSRYVLAPPPGLPIP